MWFSFSRKARRALPTRPARNRFRPRLEALEDRCLLTAGALDTAFGNLGDFLVSLNAAGQPTIINDADHVFPNPNFGRNNLSLTQEGIDNRRSVRLKLRFTF